LSSAGPRQAAESGSFLKKRTKKLCEFGFGLSWRTEAEIIKSFLVIAHPVLGIVSEARASVMA
jgi:hypothetical protein